MSGYLIAGADDLIEDCKRVAALDDALTLPMAFYDYLRVGHPEATFDDEKTLLKVIDSIWRTDPATLLVIAPGYANGSPSPFDASTGKWLRTKGSTHPAVIDAREIGIPARYVEEIAPRPKLKPSRALVAVDALLDIAGPTEGLRLWAQSLTSLSRCKLSVQEGMSEVMRANATDLAIQYAKVAERDEKIVEQRQIVRDTAKAAAGSGVLIEQVRELQERNEILMRELIRQGVDPYALIDEMQQPRSTAVAA